MTATTYPDNITPLNPIGFQFSIQKFPELTYFLQEAQLPSMTLGEAVQVSSVHDVRLPGEAITFSDLQITFMVDHKMENYLAIYKWMAALGFPEGHDIFTAWLANPKNILSPTENAKTMSDTSLTILDANNLPVNTFTFVDCFPTGLSALTFQSTNTDVQYFQATVTLAYSYYKLTNS